MIDSTFPWLESDTEADTVLVGDYRIRRGDLVLVRGGMGVLSEIVASPQGEVSVRVTRGPSATLYWLHEITPVVSSTLRDAVEKLGQVRTRAVKHSPEDPAASLKEFREEGWDDLKARAIGDADSLTAAYVNSVFAVDYLSQTAVHLQGRSVDISQRLNHGIVPLFAAGQMIKSALLLHLRQNLWHENATLIVLRAALDAIGAASAILTGPESHLKQWLSDNRVDTGQSLPILRGLLSARRPGVSDPWRVFSWLSEYTHVTMGGVMRNHQSSSRPIAHSDAYATISYVSWACAIVAELALGYPDVAQWPGIWPDLLPWD